jgi:hypothetical protein
MSVENQICVLFAGVRGFVDRIDVSFVREFETGWSSFSSNKGIGAAIVENNYTVTDNLDIQSTELCEEYTSSFSS